MTGQENGIIFMKVPVMAVIVAGNFAMRVVKADVWTASQVTELRNT